MSHSHRDRRGDRRDGSYSPTGRWRSESPSDGSPAYLATHDPIEYLYSAHGSGAAAPAPPVQAAEVAAAQASAALQTKPTLPGVPTPGPTSKAGPWIVLGLIVLGLILLARRKA